MEHFPNEITEVIAEDEMYTLREVRRRLHLGKKALDELRASCVPILHLGRHKFILGRDLIHHLQQRSR